MQKYIFILGSNWMLSLSEINHILQKEEYKGKIVDYSACSAIVEFKVGEINEKKIANLIFALGGTQKICKIVDFIEHRTFHEAFPQNIEGHPGIMIDARKHVEGILKDISYPIFGRIDKNAKYFVANSIYPIKFKSEYYKTLVNHFLHFTNKTWVKLLKEKGARSALYYRYPDENIKTGNLNPIYPHHFMKYELYTPNRKEIVYSLTEEGIYIGFSLNVSNSNEMKMIDEERPYINMKGSIAPKFAKILLSFANLQRPLGNRRILDPFCGTGTILLFAYIQGIQVFGADIEQKSISGTKNNLKWIQNQLEKPLKINFNNNLIKSDIEDIPSKFDGIKFDGIVTEPILLPYFKDLPKYDQINEIIQNQTIPTYRRAFISFKKVLKKNSRVCITSPSVITLDGGRIIVDLNEIVKGLGYRRIDVLNQETIAEKSDKELSLGTRRNLLFDASSKYFRRLFYIFESL
ncbi:MAG: methyltransferase domain-containing protein [archaeon]|nr:methyltransferase domain-containing protein [archaeon]